jgi:hypothetical protein
VTEVKAMDGEMVGSFITTVAESNAKVQSVTMGVSVMKPLTMTGRADGIGDKGC